MIIQNSLFGVFLLVTLSTVTSNQDPCEDSAQRQADADLFELREDLQTTVALCLNLSDPAERAECLDEAREEYADGLVEAQEKLMARLELCDLLGGGVYDPQIDPADFSTVIDNPHLPYPVGATWIYESDTSEGLETVVVSVLPETRELLGVECVSVQDTVCLDGEIVEDTTDWYAQDSAGNVWYFGEISLNFEDGFLVDVDGSWLSGVDGAKPGIVMLADPVVGTTYRQEWLPGEAEDYATVLADDVSVTIGLGTFGACVQTADLVPLEPGELEHKFFAPGIGLIYETKPGEPETLELVSVTGL